MTVVKYLDDNGLSTVWSKVKGIVTPKADKVSGATAGHLAGLNGNGNLMDSGVPASNVAQKDGSYSGMTVGAAEDLVSAESVASEFTSRITGGSTAVGKGGTALVDKIKGRTLVWNQLLELAAFYKIGNTEISSIEHGYSVTSTSNYIQVCSGNITNFSPGHKYLVVFNIAPGSNLLSTGSGHQIIVYHSVSGVKQRNYLTISSGKNALMFTYNGYAVTCGLQFQIYSQGEAFTSAAEMTNIMCFDLTLMFGAGNEPATAEEFEALYPLPYYDYNPGTLISNAATAIETVGFNQWDEEWEVGSINEKGVPATSSGTMRSKNFCHMMPNTVYKGIAEGRSDYLVVYFYDGNYNLIPYSGVDAYANGYNGTTTFTSPAGTAYFKFRTSPVYGATYKNDICFNISDPSRNGTYEPYWRSELDLNIPTLTGKLNGTGNSVVIFPDGLRSAGTVYDEIVGNKAIKRIGSVDMGTLTWGYSSSYGFYGGPISLAKAVAASAVASIISPRYTTISYVAVEQHGSDKNIALGGYPTGTRVIINDNAYSDAATFKAAMAGVMLYYELATPEEYILDEAIPTAMRNDPYGTERRLPEDTAATITAPFRADITYSTNIKEAVQSLPQNYINVNSMQDFLAALGTLMGGTWTMRPADGKFDFTFTPNPVEPTL